MPTNQELMNEIADQIRKLERDYEKREYEHECWQRNTKTLISEKRDELWRLANSAASSAETAK